MASKKLNAVITIGGAVSSSLRSAFGTVKNETAKIGSALRSLEGQQRQLSTAIQTFGRMGKDVDGMRSRYALLTTQVDKLRVANENLLRIERQRTDNAKQQASLKAKMRDTALVGAAIALPAVAMFKSASQFNYDLQVIGNTADLTQDRIKSLGLTLLKTSDVTGQSATGLKSAVGFLVAAGQEVGVAQANLTTIGRTATATASEIEDVAKASFTLGDALKINPTQMQKALDILVQSGKEGNFEFKAMAAELPTLGASFQALKMTGTEAVASMGAALQIARKGASNEAEAANNMTNFLAKVLSPETLKKAEKLNSDLYGVVSGAQNRGENPMEAAIKEIDRITKGGDQKLLGELFGDMQVQSFLRPMLQNLEEYERIKAKALAADGVVDRDFAKMMATSKEQVEALGDAFSGLGKVVGDALEPVIGRLATTITPVVRAARDFVSANPALVGGVIAAAGAFTVLRLAMLGTRLAFTVLGGQALAASSRIALLKANTILAGGAMPLLAARLASVGIAVRAVGLALVATPIGAILAGVATAGLLIYRHWDGVSAFLVGAFEGIKSGLQPLVDTFTAFGAALTPLHPLFDMIGGALKTAWAWFTNLLGPVTYTQEELGKAGAAGKSFGEALAAGINFVLIPLNTLITGLTWVANNIGGIADKAIAFKNAAGGAVGDAWNKTKSFFGGDEAPATGAPGSPVASLPTPAMATAKGQAGSYTDQSQNTFQVIQQPGENSRDLARRITEEQQRQRGIRQRNTMADGVTAQ